MAKSPVKRKHSTAPAVADKDRSAKSPRRDEPQQEHTTGESEAAAADSTQQTPAATQQQPPTTGAPTPQPLSAEEEERWRVWDLFSEDYHDIINDLPLQFQRNFQIMRGLEDTQQASFDSAKVSLLSYLKTLPTLPTGKKDKAAKNTAGKATPNVDALLNMSKALKSALRAGEDKVSLALRLYETVDRHIQRLDMDLAKCEDNLLMGLRDGTQPSHDAPSAARKSPPGPTTSRGAIALGEKDAYSTVVAEDEEESKKSRKERKLMKKPPPGGERRKDDQQRFDHATLHGQMPIDPAEPLYCLCNRVSFGEMVGCENEDCPREWFHFECVGLTEAPSGKWWCPDCRKAREEQNEKNTVVKPVVQRTEAEIRALKRERERKRRRRSGR
ncbi:hypothetical protein ACM66B_002370 [Microbotryomycetes sp. NB124-2]